MADDFSANISTKARLMIDTPAFGAIELAGDTDWFKITLAAGQKIQCNLDGSTAAAGTLENPYLRGIYDSRGVLLPNTSNDNFDIDVNSQVTFTASTAGDYFIAAGAAGNGIGTYTLGVIDLTSRLRIEAFDAALDEGNSGSTTLSFTVSREGDDSSPASARWTVSGSSAHPASISDFGGSAFPSGTVQFAAGENSASVDVNVRGDLSLESDEGFKVVLSLPLGAILDTSASQTSFTESTYGDAGVSEIFYTLSAAGGTFSLTTDANAISARAEIYVNGVLKAASNSYLPFDGSLSIPATTVLQADDLIDVVLTGADGQTSFDFTVSYGPGLRSARYIAVGTIINDEPVADDYFAGSATTGALTIGGGTTGRIDTPGDNDWLGIRLVAGESYLFHLDAAAQAGITDPYLELFSASGILLASDDDHGAGSAAQIAYTATASSTVYLAASSVLFNETGQYQLYATRTRSAGAPADDFYSNTSSTGRVAAGGTAAAGKIDTRGDTDWFAVTLVAGQETTFDMEAAKFSPLSGPYLELFSSNGNLIDSSDAVIGAKLTSLSLSVAQSGVYYLAASSADPVAATGSYLLSVEASGAAPITTGNTAPKLVSITSKASAIDGVTKVALEVNFDKPIERGSGGIFLETASGTFIESFDAASSSRLTVSGSTVTIAPHAILPATAQYNLIFAPETFEDLAARPWAGNTSISIAVPLTGTNSLLLGTIGIDTQLGGDGSDTFIGTRGDDLLNGGNGLDTARFSGPRSSYTVAKSVTGWTVSSTIDGVDTLFDVERLKFSDTAIGIDLDGIGGMSYRIYQAAFARTPDQGGLGYWISVMDAGASLRDIAGGFLTSDEYKSIYGVNASNAELVGKYYQNILGRPPEKTGADYWTSVLDAKADTVAGVLSNISESAENKAGLIAIIGNGFEFTPFG